jgi:pimeloyl-ACP methyl ester carboxylesterase
VKSAHIPNPPHQNRTLRYSDPLTDSLIHPFTIATATSSSLLCIVLFLLSLVALEMQAQPAAPPTDINSVRYRTAKVDAVEIFYREAGPTNGPVILLLHGFPASSFMYRDLIPRLAGRFRVVAPDYPGFGYSSAPATNEFDYTFDHLSEVMDRFTGKLGLSRYAICMQDFGGPVGFRLATRHPEKVSALVVQNANAYTEGLPDSFWSLAKALWKEPSPANFTKLREAAMSDAALEWNYTHGVADPARISPDSWVLQRALLERKGNKDAMMALLYDYRRNLDQYPKWHDYFRKHQPPTLIVWGRNDIIFPPSGAHPYLRDLPKAELHLLDTGHFALEDKHAEIAALMADFLGRKLTR